MGFCKEVFSRQLEGVKPSHTTFTPGPYSVKVANSNCTDSSAVINVNVPCLPPSDPISKINSEKTPEIETWYSDNLLYVNATGVKGDSWSMKIFDLLGNIVFEQNGKVDQSITGYGKFENESTLSVAKGIYFVSLETEINKQVRKIVIP